MLITRHNWHRPKTTSHIPAPHNGVMINLANKSELALWLAERKARFPTRARREQAEKEAALKRARQRQRREIAEEEKKLAHAAANLERKKRKLAELADEDDEEARMKNARVPEPTTADLTQDRISCGNTSSDQAIEARQAASAPQEKLAELDLNYASSSDTASISESSEDPSSESSESDDSDEAPEEFAISKAPPKEYPSARQSKPPTRNLRKVKGKNKAERREEKPRRQRRMTLRERLAQQQEEEDERDVIAVLAGLPPLETAAM